MNSTATQRLREAYRGNEQETKGTRRGMEEAARIRKRRKNKMMFRP